MRIKISKIFFTLGEVNFYPFDQFRLDKFYLKIEKWIQVLK